MRACVRTPAGAQVRARVYPAHPALPTPACRTTTTTAIPHCRTAFFFSSFNVSKKIDGGEVEKVSEATTPETMSFSEFAKHAGFKPSYVTQLRHEGRLVLTENGKRVLVNESLQRIQDTRDPARRDAVDRHAANRGAEIKNPTIPSTTEDEEEDEESDNEGAPRGKRGTSAFQEARARRENFLALQAQRDYEVSMKQLLNAAEVEDAIASAVTAFRTTFENLPDRLAPTLVGLSDEHVIRSMLADEFELALNRLATEFRKRNQEDA